MTLLVAGSLMGLSFLVLFSLTAPAPAQRVVTTADITAICPQA
jgi:hypothetical protein